VMVILLPPVGGVGLLSDMEISAGKHGSGNDQDGDGTVPRKHKSPIFAPTGHIDHARGIQRRTVPPLGEKLSRR